jgi:hypothetical protein
VGRAPRAFGQLPGDGFGASTSLASFGGSAAIMAGDGAHGPYSEALHLSAEGSANERHEGLTMLQKMVQLLAAQLPIEATGDASASASSPPPSAPTSAMSASQQGHPLFRQQEELLPQSTQYAIADVVAIRCADPNVRVQLKALEVARPLLRVMSPAAVDASSSRWVSCITSALGCSHVHVGTAARHALQTLLLRSTEANLRSMLSTLCITVTGARNPNVKTTLITALADVVMRHRALVSRAAAQTKAVQEQVMTTLVLTQSDLAFATETGLRLFTTDARPEVLRAAQVLLCTLYEHGYDWDERHILDNPRLTRDQWTQIKACLAEHARNCRSPQH